MMLSTAQPAVARPTASPIVSPTQDMVLGCYYLTLKAEDDERPVSPFASEEDAVLAYHLGRIDPTVRSLALDAPIDVEVEGWSRWPPRPTARSRARRVTSSAGS